MSRLATVKRLFREAKSHTQFSRGFKLLPISGGLTAPHS
jgi:hypothetical protein